MKQSFSQLEVKVDVVVLLNNWVGVCAAGCDTVTIARDQFEWKIELKGKLDLEVPLNLEVKPVDYIQVYV